MKGWTGSSDEVQCCPSTLGPVGSDEMIARLTLIRTKEPLHYTWLNRKDLFPGSAEFSNICGKKSGCSVDRRNTLTDDDLYARSEAFAALGNNRLGDGAYLIKVATLRQYRLQSLPDQQLLFVYDDAIVDQNEEHAVIRASTDVPDEERAILIEDLRANFGRNHLKPA